MADTIRYTFANDADSSRVALTPVDIISGTTSYYASALYAGIVGNVTGTLDVTTEGGVSVLSDFDLTVRVNHGLPQGLIDRFGTDNFDAFAELRMTYDAATVTDLSYGVRISQDFNFSAQYGEPYQLFGVTHAYDPDDTTLYPWSMNLDLERLTGLAANGGDIFSLNTLQMDCEDRNHSGQITTASCAGYYQSNRATWNGTGTTSLAISSETVSPAAVPLPAAGWGLLAGLAGLGAMRKRRQR